LDLQLQEWLEHSAKPRLVVATKSDKLSNNELKESLGRVKRVFPADRVVAYSAKTGRGRNEVWQAIETAVGNFNPRKVG
jgi:GTP-binding protein